jgi:hypothetical protein
MGDLADQLRFEVHLAVYDGLSARHFARDQFVCGVGFVALPGGDQAHGGDDECGDELFLSHALILLKETE